MKVSNATQRIAIEIAGRVASSLGSSVEEVNSKLGSIGKMAQTAAKIAGGAFAAIQIGGFISDSVSLYGELEQSMANFQAQTGLTNDQMQGIEESTRNLFKNNYGEDIADIADSMAIVRQQTGLYGKDLEDTTKNALILSDTFDFEVSESIRTAQMMMQKFGYTSEEAYNLIAQGVQKGLNKNDNLLDSINEYSVHFKKMGLDGEDMMNIFASAAEVGVFDLDKVGDAVKEFSIRAIDGSDSTVGAYEKLGLNADEMAQKFTEGGDIASKAFEETLKAIESIEDPVKQDAIGVALFGTMWEDMGKEAIFALDNTEGKLSKTQKTLKEIDNQKYDTMQSALEQMSKSIDDAKLSLVESFGPEIAQSIGNLATNVIPKASEALGSLIEPLGPEISDAINYLATDILPLAIDATKEFGEILKSPVIEKTKEFVDWISDGSTRLEEFNDFVQRNKTTLEIAAIAVGALTTALVAYKSKAIIAAVATGIEYAQIWIYCAATDAATIATGLLSGAMAFLTSPVTLVIAAIAGLVAIGAYLYNNWDTLVVKANELATAITTKFPWMADIVNAAATVIGGIAEGLKNTFGGIVTFVSGVFSGNWGQAWQGVVDIFSGIFQTISSVAKAPINMIIGFINTAISGINSLNVSVPDWVPGVGGKSIGFSIPKIPQLAEGGIATRSVFAEIGEGSEPEAVTPISKLADFINGYIQPQQSQTPQITYSPQIIIQGNANQSDIQQALKVSQSEFDSMMKKWLFSNRRVTF